MVVLVMIVIKTSVSHLSSVQTKTSIHLKAGLLRLPWKSIVATATCFIISSATATTTEVYK